MEPDVHPTGATPGTVGGSEYASEGSGQGTAQTPARGTRHPGITGVLKFFAYAHLPAPLAEISRTYSELAYGLADNPKLDGPELTVALRKLLESKDAAVRSAL